jgi:hypothetical protein
MAGRRFGSIGGLSDGPEWFRIKFRVLFVGKAGTGALADRTAGLGRCEAAAAAERASRPGASSIGALIPVLHGDGVSCAGKRVVGVRTVLGGEAAVTLSLCTSSGSGEGSVLYGSVTATKVTVTFQYVLLHLPMESCAPFLGTFTQTLLTSKVFL